MLFRKRKFQQEQVTQHNKEIKSLKAKETKRINAATQPMQDLNKLLTHNGITLEIKKAIGGRHV